MEWVFNGIGTELIVLVIGLIVGGGVGGVIVYKKFAVKKINQKAKAKNHSAIFQIGGDYKHESK